MEKSKKKAESEEEDEYDEEDEDYGDERRPAVGGKPHKRGLILEDDYLWFSDSSTGSFKAAEERSPRLCMYAAFTQYEVVKDVAKNDFDYHLTKND
jgi:tubulin polyglutamylase TTLL6/13